MNILVLGGAGFIGQNLIKGFIQRNRVTTTIHETHPSKLIPSVNYLTNIDLTNAETVRRILASEKFDIVIQAAAVTTGSKDTIERPHIHVSSNAIMNSVILQELYNTGFAGHFIFFSCGVMYRTDLGVFAQKEMDWDANDDIFPPYFGIAHTKIYIERMMEFYSRIGKFKCTVIRNSNIYGPYDKFDLNKSHLVGATIAKAMQADNELEVWGTGEGYRDLVYIDDLINLVNLVIHRQWTKSEIFNCGQGFGISIPNIIKTIIDATGKNLIIQYNSHKPNLPVSIVLDSSKAKELLGWNPTVNFETGIRRTIKWINDNNEKRLLQ